MRFNSLFVALVLSCLCFAMAHKTFEDCCLKYVKELNRKTQRHAMDYRVQRADGDCNINAIVLIMRRGRKICTDPKETWVKDLMEKIDQRQSTSSKRKGARKGHPRNLRRA